jgi:hypothetical protein
MSAQPDACRPRQQRSDQAMQDNCQNPRQAGGLWRGCSPARVPLCRKLKGRSCYRAVPEIAWSDSNRRTNPDRISGLAQEHSLRCRRSRKGRTKSRTRAPCRTLRCNRTDQSRSCRRRPPAAILDVYVKQRYPRGPNVPQKLRYGRLQYVAPALASRNYSVPGPAGLL